MLLARHFVFWFGLFIASSLALADDVAYNRTIADPAAPDCYNGDQIQEINTSEVLGWKSTTANQYQDRGHIWGIVLGPAKQKNDHTHFIVLIGDSLKDTLEIVYNREFGELPSSMDGAIVEACGDYITSNKKAGHYMPSPAGAILHWVHEALGPGDHESGFLVIDGKLFGYDNSSAKAKNPKKKPQDETTPPFDYFAN